MCPQRQLLVVRKLTAAFPLVFNAPGTDMGYVMISTIDFAVKISELCHVLTFDRATFIARRRKLARAQ